MSRLAIGGLGLALLAPAAAAQSVSGGFGDAVFGPAVVQDTHVLGSLPLASADLNEDGRADLVACDQEPLLMDRFLGQASGGIGDFMTVPLPPGAGPFPRPLLGDVTGDGHVDLLVHGTISTNLITLPGLGDGTFGAALAAGTLPPASNGPRLGDADEDGVLDLLFHNGTPVATISWAPGHGDGTFGAPVVIGTGKVVSSLVLADLDLDGTPDLANIEDGHVAVRFGLGGGAFGAPQPFSGYAASALVTADMDRDGLPDLVHAGVADVATVVHGLGGGAFGDSLSVTLVPLLRDLAAVDVDRDGFPDLLALGGFPPVLAARRMDRDGPLGEAHAYALPVFNGTGNLVPADFDGDGLLDAGTTSFSDAELITVTNALGPFVDLGFAVTSVQGTAQLKGFGTPQPGSLVSVHETAPAFPAPGLLVGGLQALDVPFLGSTFVPDPGFVIPLGVSSTELTGFWPAGFPAGVPLYLQAVHALAGGGMTISNALMILSE